MIFHRKIITLIILSSLMGTAYGQLGHTTTSSYPRSGERYITDTDGIIKMWVNIWGQVTAPGSYLVYDGIDLASLISISGGPSNDANLKKIRLFRELPDVNGKLTQVINLEKFLKSGDKSDFTGVLPNDTYVIPQYLSSYLISNLDIVNTLLSFYNLYTIAQIRQEQSNYYDNQ